MKKITCLVACYFFMLSVFAQPVISSFEPAADTIGASVIIHGTGFNTIAAANIVFFGAAEAVVTEALDTSLTVIVPSGATYQPITVTNNGLTACSVNSFTVTFTGGNSNFTPYSFLPGVEVTAGMYPHCVLEADFDRDGKNDILVSRGSSNYFSVFPNTSNSGDILLGSKSDFQTSGNNHEGAAIGDIDGDGRPDIVITNSIGSNSVSVFRNNSNPGTISFGSNIDYPAGNSPYSVAIGDLNGDGKPDMVIANNGSNMINIYPNTSTPGSISFGTRIDSFAGTNPYSVIIQDLDADGKPDLVFTTQGSNNSISVLKNTSTNGAISFNAPVNYAAISGPFTVYAGDLNGDGKPDLAAISSSNYVVVLKNTSTPGTISFGFQQSFTTGNNSSCVTISDLNGDGKPDLITSNNFSNTVSALRNTSTNGNISFDNEIEYSVGTNPLYVTCGDLDGDGRPEIISANSSTTTITILKNIIGSPVAPSISAFTPAAGINGTSVTITGSNFNGTTAVKFGGVSATSFTVDSATGITAIVGPGASGDVSVTTANGTAALPGFTFNGPVINSFSPSVGVTGTTVIITGVNFTGTTDVKFGGTSATSFTVNSDVSISATVGSGSSGAVTVTTPNGTASSAGFSFGPPSINTFSPLAGPVGSVVLISGNNFSPVDTENIVYMGAVKATVLSATPARITITVPPGASYQPITVTTNHRTASSAVPFDVTFPANDPHITDTSFVLVGSLAAGNYPVAVSLKDLNNDGKPDILAVNSLSNNLSIIKNTSTTGVLSFDPKVDFATGTDPKQIGISDLDGDGLPDLVITNFNAGGASTISVFRNTSTNSTISLSPKADYNTGNGSSGISIADLDGDGRPDIIVSSGNSGFFSFFKNISAGPGAIMLAPKQDFTLLTHPDNNTIADFDLDGKPDIVFANFSNSNISVYQNTSTGGNFSLSGRMDFNAGSAPNYISWADLNNDGKPDIILTNYSSANLSLYKNTGTNSIAFAQPQNFSMNSTNIAAGDLNGDGKPDLCTGRGLNGKISILENIFNATDTFAFAGNIDFTTGNYDTFVSIGDLDGDGKPEIAAVNTTQNTVTILRNKISDPVIASVSSVSAENGASVTINGSNFSGATSVKFGGVSAASFNVASSSQIDAVVGEGASGNITVTTPTGTAVLSGFHFIPQVSAAGDTILCGDANVLLTSSAANNNQWYKNGTTLSGANERTYAATSSGIYTVSTSSNGITTFSPTGVTVTITSVSAPTITLNGNMLVSSAPEGNQWFLDGNAIPGAVGQSYQPVQSGNYTVISTVNNCTSSSSSPYNYILSGIINLDNNQFISFYPNPVKDKLILNWYLVEVTELNVKVFSGDGKIILTKQSIHNNSWVDLSKLPKGVYFINIYDNKNKINKTLPIVRE